MPAPGDVAGEKIGLVEAALPFLPPVEGNGDDRIERGIDRKGPLKKVAERSGERRHARVLKEMDEAAQGTAVEAEAGGMVKAAPVTAAGSANTIGVERMLIRKGRAAQRAEVLGFEGFGSGEARLADGYTGPAIERSSAETTIGWKNDREKGVGDGTNR